MPQADYELIEKIGSGTYGEVLLVRHKIEKKKYVMKKIDLSRASPKERAAAIQEAKLLEKLKHANIVRYKEAFESGPTHMCIVMTYCDGGDLYHKLRAQSGKPVEEKQIIEWFVQVCMALQYMHERGILHRDLKTQNVFLMRDGTVKVGDLGIARVLNSATDMASTFIGTPYYMSPEIFQNKPYNYKSDVWALGICLYEMCTLKHAFTARDLNGLALKVIRGRMPPMPNGYSNDLLNIIKSSLHRNPDQRPSVKRILADPYIRKYIQVFIEEAKEAKEKIQPGSQRSLPLSDKPSLPLSSGTQSSNSSGIVSAASSALAAASAVVPVHAQNPATPASAHKQPAQLLAIQAPSQRPATPVQERAAYEDRKQRHTPPGAGAVSASTAAVMQSQPPPALFAPAPPSAAIQMPAQSATPQYAPVVQAPAIQAPVSNQKAESGKMEYVGVYIGGQPHIVPVGENSNSSLSSQPMRSSFYQAVQLPPAPPPPGFAASSPPAQAPPSESYEPIMVYTNSPAQQPQQLQQTLTAQNVEQPPHLPLFPPPPLPKKDYSKAPPPKPTVANVVLREGSHSAQGSTRANKPLPPPPTSPPPPLPISEPPILSHAEISGQSSAQSQAVSRSVSGSKQGKPESTDNARYVNLSQAHQYLRQHSGGSSSGVSASSPAATNDGVAFIDSNDATIKIAPNEVSRERRRQQKELSASGDNEKEITGVAARLLKNGRSPQTPVNNSNGQGQGPRLGLVPDNSAERGDGVKRISVRHRSASGGALLEQLDPREQAFEAHAMARSNAHQAKNPSTVSAPSAPMAMNESLDHSHPHQEQAGPHALLHASSSSSSVVKQDHQTTPVFNRPNSFMKAMVSVQPSSSSPSVEEDADSDSSSDSEEGASQDARKVIPSQSNPAADVHVAAFDPQHHRAPGQDEDHIDSVGEYQNQPLAYDHSPSTIRRADANSNAPAPAAAAAASKIARRTSTRRERLMRAYEHTLTHEDIANISAEFKRMAQEEQRQNQERAQEFEPVPPYSPTAAEALPKSKPPIPTQSTNNPFQPPIAALRVDFQNSNRYSRNNEEYVNDPRFFRRPSTGSQKNLPVAPAPPSSQGSRIAPDNEAIVMRRAFPGSGPRPPLPAGRPPSQSPPPELPSSAIARAVPSHITRTPGPRRAGAAEPDAPVDDLGPVAEETFGVGRQSQMFKAFAPLYKELIKALGQEVFNKAYKLLDRVDDPNFQMQLEALLGGREGVENWAGKLWQVKYLEEALYGSSSPVAHRV